jgi:hypothetical protein
MDHQNGNVLNSCLWKIAAPFQKSCSGAKWGYSGQLYMILFSGNMLKHLLWGYSGDYNQLFKTMQKKKASER